MRRLHMLAASVVIGALLILFLYQNHRKNNAFTRYISLHKSISTAVKLNNSSPPWWDGGDCGCKRAHNNMAMMSGVGGTCGARAWVAGDGQRVIAYCLFGKNEGYYKGLGETLKEAEQFYPEFYVRLYTEPTTQNKQIICPLLCQFPRFHVCNVKALPVPLGDVTKRDNDDPHMWRFLPMGDPQIEVLLVRDSDAKILPREVSAVEEWLASGVALHAMRDHPGHKACILAGMWGVRADHNTRSLSPVNTPAKLAEMRNQMMNFSKGNFYCNDQNALRFVVWKALKDSSMRHESYRCLEFPDVSRPFPTKRQGLEFINSRWYRYTNEAIQKEKYCPSECRPQDHQDWIYC